MGFFSFVFSHIEVRTQRTFEQSSRVVVRMLTDIYHHEQCQSPGHQQVSAPLWNTESRIKLSQFHHADQPMVQRNVAKPSVKLLGKDCGEAERQTKLGREPFRSHITGYNGDQGRAWEPTIGCWESFFILQKIRKATSVSEPAEQFE